MDANKFVVTLDMKKAYDIIKCGFLVEVMTSMCLQNRWVNWIEACISKVEHRVVLNSKKSNPFRPSRGIWQGDLISP